MRKFLLAAIFACLTTAANAVTIDVGWWDNINGIASGVTPVYHQDSGALFTRSGYGSNYFGPTFGGVLSALAPGNFYEAAINDIFATGVGTARIYVTFSGITTVDNALNFPNTLFQRTENALHGWIAAEQIFLCGSTLFCDNFIVGSGTLIGYQDFVNGTTGNFYQNLSGIAPGQPFSITEVFHLVSDGVENAHWAGAIVTNPVASVPGPIVGAGLPGLAALGLLWLARRRRRG